MHDSIARLLRLSSDEESFKYFCRLIITTTQQGYGWWEGKVHEHWMLYIRRKGFQVCLHCNLATCKLPNCFTLMHIGASQFGSHHCIHLMQKFHACLLPLISVEVWGVRWNFACVLVSTLKVLEVCEHCQYCCFYQLNSAPFDCEVNGFAWMFQLPHFSW